MSFVRVKKEDNIFKTIKTGIFMPVFILVLLLFLHYIRIMEP
ncbi:hypothetical protein HMPREF0381_1812 [Lachnoanaerobaculum saburreum DSM 3986]|uniref:Uncharacterized protein n=1 Tax=Lachnoanaerobaculum saburreum DSM 3986 TaxID=887325 RepID=E6LPC7_9FIRM|nr:hypothetical protein HMPREF0381_1812 [Lachnoanaerobaculum saburreum DSM 3986]